MEPWHQDALAHCLFSLLLWNRPSFSLFVLLMPLNKRCLQIAKSKSHGSLKGTCPGKRSSYTYMYSSHVMYSKVIHVQKVCCIIQIWQRNNSSGSHTHRASPEWESVLEDVIREQHGFTWIDVQRTVKKEYNQQDLVTREQLGLPRIPIAKQVKLNNQNNQVTSRITVTWNSRHFPKYAYFIFFWWKQKAWAVFQWAQGPFIIQEMWINEDALSIQSMVPSSGEAVKYPGQVCIFTCS